MNARDWAQMASDAVEVVVNLVAILIAGLVALAVLAGVLYALAALFKFM